MYSARSLASRPSSIPRLFDDDIGIDLKCEQQQNVDIHGQPFTTLSPEPARTPGLIHAAFDLAEIFQEIANYNIDQPTKIGSDDDVTERAKLYLRILELKASLPSMFRQESNFTVQTCFLA